MFKNAFDLSVSTTSSRVVDMIDRFLFAMLSFSKEADVIYTAVSLDPECAIANAYAASLSLFVGSQDALAQATPYIEAAVRHQEQATEHERRFITAIEAWAKRDMARAIAAHEAIAQQYPRDLLSVQICQFHYANTGNIPGLLDIAQQTFPANADNPFAYAMLAFGLEENHQLEAAEIWGRKATDLHRVHPWAHHAVAHVLETQGRLEDGITWMNSVSDTWNTCGSSFYTHLWWHTALFHLDLDNTPVVLNLYDQHIWDGARKTAARDQIHSIALLIRLELRGVEVGDRWLEMAAYLQPRVTEHVIPFWDLHFIYALTRAGQEDWADEMLSDLQQYSQTVFPSLRPNWAEVTVPAARGLLAHARGDWTTAVRELESVRDRLYLVGGSHAQRDLFEQIYLDGLIRLGERQKAIALLYNRVQARGKIPAVHRAITQIASA
jgi:hypothetical protein